MCLIQISTKKNRDKFLKKASRRGYIRVYKVCRENRTGWTKSRAKVWIAGLRKANSLENMDADCGWHACLSKRKAEIYYAGNPFEYIKVCYAKPAWLKGLSLRTKEASFTHLVFPEWDKGDMTIREFRAICKENQK